MDSLTGVLMTLAMLGLAVLSQVPTPSPFATVLSEATTRIEQLETELGIQGTAVEQVSSTLNDVSEQVDRIEDDVLREHANILQSISQRDSSDNIIPSIRANMDASVEFQREMSEVLNQSIKPTGQLFIHNETNRRQLIYVNETVGYWILPYSHREVEVATGNVSTRLDGKNTVNWMLGPPGYMKSIKIVDRYATKRVAPRNPIVPTPVLIEPTPWEVVTPWQNLDSYPMPTPWYPISQ